MSHERAAAEGMLGLLARDAKEPDRELQIKAAAIEAHARFMLGELTRIVRAFEAASIPILAFKGPVLSQQLYGDPGLRSFSDLDVIVSPSCADDAEALLRELGYREQEPLADAERKTNRRFTGELLLTNDEKRTLVDFHTRFSNEQFPLRLSFDDVWHRRKHVLNIPSLGDEDLVVVTCSHAAKHLWHRREFLAQIAALASKPADWSFVDRLAVEARASRQVGLSFLLARDAFGIDLPPLPQCLARATPLHARAKALAGTRHDATGRDLFVLLDRRRDAWRAFALAVFVPTHADWEGSKSSWTPWLRRPLRLLRRKM